MFQPRSFGDGVADSEGHVEALVEAMRNTKGHLLDPVTVWWSGARYIVIDGHHRIKAYRKMAKGRAKIAAVPVVEFRGTLHDAIAEAARLNSKDKLPMSRDDKFEMAWKLVGLQDPKWSKRKISEAAGVGERTVAYMRAKVRELEGEAAEHGEEWSPLELTWKEARQGERIIADPDEWIDRLARKWARRLGKEFGKKFATKPEVAARALERYSENLPERLIGEWWEIVRDVSERRANEPDGDF